MRILLIFFLALLLNNCSKPKTVLICGDHICVNKLEAEQYFKESLSLEVKIIDPENNEEMSLVELNLKESDEGDKKISVLSKKSTDQNLKVLSKNEIKKIKTNLKNIQNNQRFVKKLDKRSEKKNKIKNIKNEKKILKDKKNVKKTFDGKKLNKEKNIKLKDYRNKEKIVKNKINDVIDVCTILEKCSIDEISKYLLEQGKKKNFPDITMRQ